MDGLSVSAADGCARWPRHSHLGLVDGGMGQDRCDVCVCVHSYKSPEARWCCVEAIAGVITASWINAARPCPGISLQIFQNLFDSSADPTKCGVSLENATGSSITGPQAGSVIEMSDSATIHHRSPSCCCCSTQAAVYADLDRRDRDVAYVHPNGCSIAGRV